MDGIQGKEKMAEHLQGAPVVVRIVGTPEACADGVKDTWREVAVWAGGQLKARFGDSLAVEYFDLFDPDCPPMPAEAQLPLVLINDEVVSSGGKVSVPAIRKRLEEGYLCPRP